MKKESYVEQFLYAAWNYSKEDIEAGLRANDDMYQHFSDKLKSKQSRHGGTYGLLNFLFELTSDRKQKFIKAFTWNYVLMQAVNKVTKERVMALDYGDQEDLGNGFVLYHYTEEDIIVIGYEDEADYSEILQVMIDGKDLIYETL